MASLLAEKMCGGKGFLRSLLSFFIGSRLWTPPDVNIMMIRMFIACLKMRKRHHDYREGARFHPYSPTLLFLAGFFPHLNCQ
ncbi:hypothetical protein JOC94_002037 [Bacillus thermophilus]|uniref:Secreted protein n=1 Tax=Siminovitchia thermophila TaxID=1245522 RepID=A0ABS2R6N7_9BACI|nr:hypothetical protein [Siminovitchia thermophila]